MASVKRMAACGAVAFAGALAICSSASATIVQAEFTGVTVGAFDQVITSVLITLLSSGYPSSWIFFTTPQ